MTNGQTKIWNKKPQELKANPSHAGKPVGMASRGQDEKTWICCIRKILHHSLQWQGQQGKRLHHREPAGATALPPLGSEESQPWSGKANSGASCPELTPPPCLLLYKNIAPLFCQGVWACLAVTATTSSIWGKAVMLASCMMNCPELPGSRLAHGDSTYNSTSVKTSAMNTSLSLLRPFEIKLPLKCWELWWSDYYNQLVSWLQNCKTKTRVT